MSAGRHDRLGGQGRPHTAGAHDIVLRAEWNFSRAVATKSPGDTLKSTQIPETHTRPAGLETLGMLPWNLHSVIIMMTKHTQK